MHAPHAISLCSACVDVYFNGFLETNYLKNHRTDFHQFFTKVFGRLIVDY